MTTPALHDALTALTAAVAAEHEAAGTLAYRLTTARLLLDAGEPQLLAQGLAELELAAAHLEATGRRRAQSVADLAGPLGLEPGRATLSALVDRVGDPWSSTLAEHQDVLGQVVERIGREAMAHRLHAQRALDQVRERLGQDPRPRHLDPVPHPRERELVADLDLAAIVTELRVREVTYEALVELTSSPLPAGLLAFVESASSPSLTSPAEG